MSRSTFSPRRYPGSSTTRVRSWRVAPCRTGWGTRTRVCSPTSRYPPPTATSSSRQATTASSRGSARFSACLSSSTTPGSRTTRTAPRTGTSCGRCWSNDCARGRSWSGSGSCSRQGCHAARSTPLTRAWPSPPSWALTRWSPSGTATPRCRRSGTRSRSRTRRPGTSCRLRRWTSTATSCARGSPIPAAEARTRPSDLVCFQETLVTAPTQDSSANRYPTSLGTSDADTITLLGQDLATDLMGKVGFGELAFWLVARERPTPSQVRVFEAVLVALADHGFTPTAIAARLTYLSAPDSLQGALAAGLLGGGSRFLGVTEDCGAYLAAVLADVDGDLPTDDAGWDALALEAVRRTREARRFVPGLGHPVHKVRDPRTDVLIGIADQEGLRGPHLRLFEAIGRVHEQVLGRRLPLNGAGVCGAALADLGLPVELLRGFALLARAAGLLGQIAEERRRPIGMDAYLAVDRNAVYVDPAD